VIAYRLPPVETASAVGTHMGSFFMSRPNIYTALALVAGCLTGSVAAGLAIPEARAAASPTRWEHLCAADLPSEAMNKIGADGWEMVGVASNVRGWLQGTSTTFVYCFKRVAR